MNKVKIILLLCFLLGGCESNHPFNRGPAQDGQAQNEKGTEDEKLDEKKDPIKVEDNLKKYYLTYVQPLINADCFSCHPGSNAPEAYEDAKALIRPGAPEASDLYLMVTGRGHIKVWGDDTDSAKALAKWIILEGQKKGL